MEDVDGSFQTCEKFARPARVSMNVMCFLVMLAMSKRPSHISTTSRHFLAAISIVHDVGEVTAENLEVVLVEDVAVVLGDSICKSPIASGTALQKELLTDDRVPPPTLAQDPVHSITWHPHHTIM